MEKEYNSTEPNLSSTKLKIWKSLLCIFEIKYKI